MEGTRAHGHPEMEYRQLGNTDMKVSVLSCGGSALGGVFRATEDSEALQVVRDSLRAGVNYIDTAPWYGNGRSEEVLGQALKEVPRSSYYIATKVGRYAPKAEEMFDFSAERTMRSVDESLRRLGLDYVDVIQIHDMEFAPSLDVILNETLPALQKVRDAGKARYIGITGYPLENFRYILERSTVKIDTILTYCHYSMNDTSLAEHLEYYKSKGLGIVNGSALSMGLLSHRGPPAWHPATADIKEVCRAAADYCEERGVDISRLAMHFSLAPKEIDTTLFSTASVKNLQSNLSTLRTPLTETETRVSLEIMDKFFKPLNNKTWEGVEVAAYWAKIKAAGADKD